MKTTIANKGLRICLLILGIQNLLLVIGFVSSDSNHDQSQSIDEILRIAFYLDIIGFFLLFIVSLVILITHKGIRRRNWILIAIGSITFVCFSIIWRATLEIFPVALLETLRLDFLMVDNPQGSYTDFISIVFRAIQFSNFGLFLTSLGFYFEDRGKSQYVILLYGIINIVFVIILSVLVIFKIVSIFLAIPYFLYKAVGNEMPRYQEVVTD